MRSEHDIDDSGSLLEQVNQALQNATPLRIQGSNSKAFLGRIVAGEVLDTRCHRGIVSYDPTELVITARCGTPLAELAEALDAAQQMLPCEPPSFGDGATVGGMIASGLSGPRRPWSGSVRDFVLGTRVITGHGKHLRFGGEVMKNVAGYDLSRLMAGSYGSLGVVTEVSLKVLPKPRQCLSISLEMDSDRALLRLAEWGHSRCRSALRATMGNACTCGLRVAKARWRRLMTDSAASCWTLRIWDDLNEHRLSFFDAGPGTLAPVRPSQHASAFPAWPSAARLGRCAALAQIRRGGSVHSLDRGRSRRACDLLYPWPDRQPVPDRLPAH